MTPLSPGVSTLLLIPTSLPLVLPALELVAPGMVEFHWLLRIVAGGPFYHAMIMDVTAGKLSAIAIDDKGKTVDQFEKVVP